MVSAPDRSRTKATDLRASGAVLLVACYELGHQPLSLASPLAYLERAGFHPRAVDTAVDELDDALIESAALVAISVPMHTALRLGIGIAERVRRLNPDARICFYGLYAWLNADYLLREHGDFVIGGEYERALTELAAALETSDGAVVPGVRTAANSVPPAIERIDFALPRRDELPELERYARLLIDGREVTAGYVEATRGCHHTCLHCPVVPIYQGRFFAIPRGVVLDDMRRQIAAGAGHISFGDPDALNGPTHLLRIVQALHAEHPEVTFDITTRIEHIIQHREITPALAEAGCLFVISAVESVSEAVLRNIDKGHTKADVVEALAILDAAGIAMRPSLLPFTPWTTLDGYIELLDFIEEHELIEQIDPVHLSIRLLVPPGSALLNRPDTATWLGPLDEENFTYTWAAPDPCLDQLQLWVASIAERAAQQGACPFETFSAIKRAAYHLAELPPPPVLQKTGRRRAPRLTESWFC